MFKLILLSIFTLALSACSTTGMMNKEKNAIYAQYIETQKLTALPRINSFRFQGWQSLTNDYLIVSTSPRKKYLLALNSYCQDLSFTHAIIINQRGSTVLSPRFDSISVVNSPKIKCFIKSIYAITKEQSKEISAIGNGESKDENKIEKKPT